MNDATLWAAVPAALAALAIALLRRAPWSARLADHPNERSLHSQPRPRIGGIGIACGVFPLALYATGGSIALILACALALAALSLADDLRSLPVGLRLAAHALAAIVVIAVIAFDPSVTDPWRWLAWLAGVLAIAWMTNLYNFMDGTDGLAGTMALVGFGAYALAASFAGRPTLSLVCLAIASASAGFLLHNLPPARVFMGDAGSIALGFLAGALGLYGFVAGAWPMAFPVLVFSPFIVDATVTLLKRLARREPVWQAHRTHYYQRLVLSGWRPRRLLFASGGVMLAAAASALVLARVGLMLQCGIIFFWAVFYALLLPAIDRKTRTNKSMAQ